ncbi:MAG: acyl-CoA dehydrogenase [Hydrocarboniphaga sp.]|uniref:acyl-CoA dehydrogenase family protein n=1 Tax=Hydrocarboniphaga sp. TaxID=2033016 RepID=UPI0026068EAC|nr:acyl-CoA dehydrogenase family protein [Hydrocarboniphaga sp.]MDB5968727.1 acyl-CoA dehydrogenase [Hydrocarboniphaga sp.]
MDFSLSDEQVLLRDSAERFVREEYKLDARRRLVAAGDPISAEHWRQYAELGWLALPIPEDVGGLGGSFVDLMVLMVALGSGCVLEPYIPNLVLCAPILDRSPARSLLGAVADGSLRLALAHDEAGDRFNLAGPRTTQATAAGDGFLLTGAKTLVLGGPSADRFIVSATITGEPACSLFLVHRDQVEDQVEQALSRYPLIDGTWAADLSLSVEVSADALIVRSDRATALLDEAIDRATLAYLAEAVGSMETCLEICSAYLKIRKQFGQAIGKFQALQHILAEMFVEAQEARSILYQALSQIGADASLRRRAVSAAKIVIGQASQIISRQGVQLHGGYGVTDEYPISHHFKRLMVIEKLFGDIEHHTTRFAGTAPGLQAPDSSPAA